MVNSIGNAPVYGTRPWVGLCPTVPHHELGMRTEPPWSPPIARSASPEASRAALPDDEPPVVRSVSHGFLTGPVTDVWLPPEKHRSSHTDLPVIVAPAASSRVPTVASRRGPKPSRVCEPFIIGTPATSMLSLTATRRPASGPSGCSWISVCTYQAPSGFSAGSGRFQVRPAGGSGADCSYSSSTASYEASRPPTRGSNEPRSA